MVIDLQLPLVSSAPKDVRAIWKGIETILSLRWSAMTLWFWFWQSPLASRYYVVRGGIRVYRLSSTRVLLANGQGHYGQAVPFNWNRRIFVMSRHLCIVSMHRFTESDAFTLSASRPVAIGIACRLQGNRERSSWFRRREDRFGRHLTASQSPKEPRLTPPIWTIIT